MTPSSSLAKSFGLTAVDWEQRVDFDRLRRERLARLRDKLDASELGALLTFDFHNIRYMTATHIGTWAMDKLIRFALLPRGGEPVIWDFGSAARHHVLTTRGWTTARALAGAAAEVTLAPEHGSRPASPPCGAPFRPTPDGPRKWRKSIKRELDKYGLAGEPVGVDVAELPVLAALHDAGIRVVDGQQVFLEARRVKTEDEISLLVTAASMVDAAYDQLYAFLRPGVRENECVGLVAKVALRRRQRARRRRERHLRRAVLATPARLQRPDLAPRGPGVLRHPALLQRLSDLLLPDFRGRQRQPRRSVTPTAVAATYMDNAIDLVRPGATTADICAVWPAAHRVRLPGRTRCLRPSIRPWGGSLDLGEAHLQPTSLLRAP